MEQTKHRNGKWKTLLSTGKYAELVTAKLIPNTCTRIHFITIKITRLETNISKSKLNSGLSPDFSVQLQVSLSERLSKRLSQKVKSPNVCFTFILVIYHVCKFQPLAATLDKNVSFIRSWLAENNIRLVVLISHIILSHRIISNATLPVRQVTVIFQGKPVEKISKKNVPKLIQFQYVMPVIVKRFLYDYNL